MRDCFPLKEKFNNAISDGTIPSAPSPSLLKLQWNVRDIKPRAHANATSALEAISKEFADTRKTIPHRRVFGTAKKEREREDAVYIRSRMTGAYLVLAPTLSQLRSWL